MANVIAILVLVVILGLAIFRIYKTKKKGGCCGCDCGCSCSGCCSGSNCCQSSDCCSIDPENPEKPIKIKK